MLNKRLFQWLTPLVLSVFFPRRENWLSSEGGWGGGGEGRAVSTGPGCVALGVSLPLSGPAQEARRGAQQLDLGHVLIFKWSGF